MKRWFCILIAFTSFASAQAPATSSKGRAASAVSNLALTVYVVSGFAQPKAAGGDDVPADLAEVLKQMQGVFAYKSYKLVEALTLHGRNNNGAELAGSLPDYLDYDFKYARARISTETPHTVRLDGLRLEITRHHYNRTDTVVLVAADLDTRDGQKTVVGKSAVNATDVMFLVIVPKVSE